MVERLYHIPGAPRLALLADLHGRDPAPVLASVQAYRPELIAIAGDFIYGSHPVDDVSPLSVQENALPFLQSCAAIAPTFLSLGNHEYMLDSTDLDAIAAKGVTLLDNKWETITVGSQRIVIGGLTSAFATDYRRFLATLPASVTASTRYPRKDWKKLRTASERVPDTSWLHAFADTPGYHILLSHHPEYYPLIPSSVNLVLSGHAHGGQWAYYSIRRRRMCGLFAPGQGFWPKWTRGVYEGRLVVSAGLSNTTRVPRICNPTEVVFIESP